MMHVDDNIWQTQLLKQSVPLANSPKPASSKISFWASKSACTFQCALARIMLKILFCLVVCLWHRLLTVLQTDVQSLVAKLGKCNLLAQTKVSLSTEMHMPGHV